MKCLWLGLQLFLCTLSPCDGYRRVERKGELYLREKERSGWKTARRCFRATNQQLWPQCASIFSRAMMSILSFNKKKCKRCRADQLDAELQRAVRCLEHSQKSMLLFYSHTFSQIFVQLLVGTWMGNTSLTVIVFSFLSLFFFFNKTHCCIDWNV